MSVNGAAHLHAKQCRVARAKHTFARHLAFAVKAVKDGRVLEIALQGDNEPIRARHFGRHNAATHRSLPQIPR